MEMMVDILKGEVGAGGEGGGELFWMQCTWDRVKVLGCTVMVLSQLCLHVPVNVIKEVVTVFSHLPF